MISNVLNCFKESLSKNIKPHFSSPGDVKVDIQSIHHKNNENVIRISFLSIEKNTKRLQSVRQTKTINSHHSYDQDFSFNMNIMISVVFNEKNYSQSLEVLDLILKKIQLNSIFKANINGQNYEFSIHNLDVSFQDLSSFSSTSDNKIFPSLFYKITNIPYEIHNKKISPVIKKISIK